MKVVAPDGYEIDKENSTFECIRFKPVEKRGKTWEEIQKMNIKSEKLQYYVSPRGDIKSETLSIDEIDSVKVNLPDERTAERVRAMCQLWILADYYNGIYERESTLLYFPAFEDGGVVYRMSEDVTFGTPIFNSEKAFNEALKYNREIFETALKP